MFIFMFDENKVKIVFINYGLIKLQLFVVNVSLRYAIVY